MKCFQWVCMVVVMCLVVPAYGQTPPPPIPMPDPIGGGGPLVIGDSSCADLIKRRADFLLLQQQIGNAITDTRTDILVLTAEVKVIEDKILANLNQPSATLLQWQQDLAQARNRLAQAMVLLDGYVIMYGVCTASIASLDVLIAVWC